MKFNFDKMRRNAIWFLVFMLLIFTGNAQNNSNTLISLKQYTVKATDGNSYQGEMGYIRVPENRSSTDSKDIEIPFFRIKTEHPDPLPPIFILEGGPGDNPSAIQQLDQLVPVLSMFSMRSDVILMDQRGNGNSSPSLRCENNFDLPLDKPLDKELFRQEYRKYIQECSNYWKGKKRDLAGYNVIRMAEDIEALRNVLSYEKIMIFGGSFGSHHGLTYIKRYPHRVERASLDSPEGLQHTIKLPNMVDKILVQLSELVQENTNLSQQIPSFTGLVKEILENLEKSPVSTTVTHPKTKEEVEITVGKYDLQLATAMALGRIRYRELPYHYLQMKSGDYSWLANQAIGLRTGGDGVNLMAVLTDCTSGINSKRVSIAEEQAEKAILGDALNNVIFEVCDLLPLENIKEELLPNFTSTIPLLLTCGSQDARTPVSNAKDIMKNFENSRLMVVKYGSHDLFKEVFKELAPIYIRYLSAENPLEYKIPDEIKAPLDFKE